MACSPTSAAYLDSLLFGERRLGMRFNKLEFEAFGLRFQQMNLNSRVFFSTKRS